MTGYYFLTLAALLVAAFLLGRQRATAVAGGTQKLHSLPTYHGLLPMAVVLLLMMATYLIGTSILARFAESGALALLGEEAIRDPLRRASGLREIINVATGAHSGNPSPGVQQAADHYTSTMRAGNIAIFAAGVGLALLGMFVITSRIGTTFRARNHFERLVLWIMGICAVVAILTTIGIVFSVLFETWRFFFDPSLKGRPTVTQFLFGTQWNPQAAIRADQGDIETSFGFLPLLSGTLLITVIAMLVAGPLGLFSAIYLSEYATPRFRSAAKPILEILAGIPTVVLGFFAALTVAPLIRGWGEHFGLSVASESALAAGLVMGMMIIPFISSLSDDVINSVPQSLRDGAYALGATQVGDDPAGGVAGCLARHRVGLHARDQPRHRRDDDRGDGRRSGCQADHQSAGSRDHDHGADRDDPRRRPGIRQRQDARGLRPRVRAVLRDAGPQHHRAAGRAQISRAV